MNNLSRPLRGPGPRPDPPLLSHQISSYEVLLPQLTAMGFTVKGIQYALESTSTPSIDSALAYLVPGDRGYEHPFLPAESDDLCIVCNDTLHAHKEYIK